MVSVRVRVVEQVSGDVAEKHIDKLAKKYMGLDKYPGRSAGEKRIILEIKTKKVFHMKYGQSAVFIAPRTRMLETAIEIANLYLLMNPKQEVYEQSQQ